MTFGSQIAQGIIVALFAAVFGAVVNSIWKDFDFDRVWYEYEKQSIPLAAFNFSWPGKGETGDKYVSGPTLIVITLTNNQDTRIEKLELAARSISIIDAIRCNDTFCREPVRLVGVNGLFSAGTINPQSGAVIYLTTTGYASLYNFDAISIIADGKIVSGSIAMPEAPDAFGIAHFVMNNNEAVFILTLVAFPMFVAILPPIVSFIAKRQKKA